VLLHDAAALGPFNKQATHGKKTTLLYFGCDDFSGWYNFGKVIKTVAIRCHILKLKCSKFDFGWGSDPDPAGGAFSTHPDPIAGFKEPTSKGKEEGKGRERRMRMSFE